jgi:hypothetical protein
MFTIDEIGELLDEVAAEVPAAFYKELNGGISLLPDTKMRTEPVAGNLYTLGEYNNNAMGRYIVIYYGSLMATYAFLERDAMRERLKQLLLHEFTHHLESLAGEHGLEDKDKAQLERYRRPRDA